MTQKNCEVKEGIWYPAIRINGIENMAILNPYGSRKTIPSTLIDNPYLREEAELCFSKYIFVGNSEKILFSNQEEYAESQIKNRVEKAFVPVDSDGKSLVYFLAKINEDQMKLKNTFPDKAILTSNEIIEIIIGSQPSTLTDSLFALLKAYENSEFSKLKNILTKQIIENNQISQPAKVSAHYISNTDSLLLFSENEVKELRREGQNFILNKSYMGGHHTSKESIIYLCISKEEFKTILDQTCWEKASSICTLLEICSLTDFFYAFKNPIESYN